MENLEESNTWIHKITNPRSKDTAIVDIINVLINQKQLDIAATYIQQLQIEVYKKRGLSCYR